MNNLKPTELLVLIAVVVLPIWFALRFGKEPRMGPRQRAALGAVLLAAYVLLTLISVNSDADILIIPAVAAFFIGVIWLPWGLVAWARQADRRGSGGETERAGEGDPGHRGQDVAGHGGQGVDGS